MKTMFFICYIIPLGVYCKLKYMQVNLPESELCSNTVNLAIVMMKDIISVVVIQFKRFVFLFY